MKSLCRLDLSRVLTSRNCRSIILFTSLACDASYSYLIDSPYQRRLESLTIRSCNYKSRTFLSLHPECWSGRSRTHNLPHGIPMLTTRSNRMTFAVMHVKWSVILSDRFGPEIVTMLEIKGQVLHRVRVRACIYCITCTLCKKTNFVYSQQVRIPSH